MNWTRIALAGVAGFVAYFILGGVLFGMLPFLTTEFQKYPAVYRSQEGQMKFMRLGMVAMLVAMLVLAIMYAMLYQGGSRMLEGASFGALIGIFSICSFVIHNYVNLNIGFKLTPQQSAAYLLEWIVAGIVIGLVYRPVPH